MTVQTCECDCHGQGKYGTCSIEGGCGTNHPERRCAQGRYCVQKDPERKDDGSPTGKWLPALIEADRGLCPACTRRVQDGITSLAEDALLLTDMLGEHGGASDVLVSSSRELRVPLRLSIEALRSEIDAELQAWAEPVAERLGATWDTEQYRRMRTMPRIVAASRFLAFTVDALLTLPDQEHPAWNDGAPVWDDELDIQDTITRDGLAGGLALLDLHRRAYAATGRTRLVYRLPAPCPRCDFLALVRHNGSDHVLCENCGEVVDEMHYHWFTRVLAAQQKAA